jgi:hypothetical protein
METSKITAGTLALIMGFAFSASGAMAQETTGNDNAALASDNESDPSGEPGNQGVSLNSEVSEGNAGGADGHDGGGEFNPGPPKGKGPEGIIGGGGQLNHKQHRALSSAPLLVRGEGSWLPQFRSP